MERMPIGELAKLTGVKPQTIRYYEQVGVLRPPLRASSGYRRYGGGTLDELTFVKRAQALGFSLEEIREILDLGRAGTAPCDRVLSLAREHVGELDARIDALGRLKDEIVNAIEQWEDGGIPANCVSTLCGLMTFAFTSNITVPPPVSRARTTRTAWVAAEG